MNWFYGVGGHITRTPPRAASLGEAARPRDPHHAKSKDIKPGRASIRNLALNIKTTGGANVAGRPRPPPCVRARRAGHPQRAHHNVACTRGVQLETWPLARMLVFKRKVALGPTQLPTTGAHSEPHARRTQVWDWRGLCRPGKIDGGTRGARRKCPLLPHAVCYAWPLARCVALGPYAANAAQSHYLHRHSACPLQVAEP